MVACEVHAGVADDFARRQERDPDRRICARARRTRHEHRRSGRGSHPAALPADPDDLDRLHPRSGAAVDRDRRRRGESAVARHGGFRRDARVDDARVPVFFIAVREVAGRSVASAPGATPKRAAPQATAADQTRVASRTRYGSRKRWVAQRRSRRQWRRADRSCESRDTTRSQPSVDLPEPHV